MARVRPEASVDQQEFPCVLDWLPDESAQEKIRWHFMALTAAGYAILAAIVLGIYSLRNDLPFMYLAAGVYWAGMLLASKREWWVLVPTIFCVQMGVEFIVYASPLSMALVIAASKTLEGLVGAALLRHYCSHTQTALRRATYFVLVAGLLLPTVFAVAPALMRTANTTADFPVDFAQWALVQASGIIIVTPAVVSAWLFFSGRIAPPRRYVEAFALAVFIIGISAAVFVFEITTHPASIYLVTPGLFWAAARFGSVFAAVCNVVVATFASVGALNETVYFSAVSSQEFAAGLCLYLLVNTAASLILGASTDDRSSRLKEIERGRLQLRELAVRANRKEDEFRAETARLVHDNLGQNLALSRIKLDLLESKLTKDLSHTGMLEEMKDILDQAIETTRSITSGVASSVHQGGSFQNSLQELLQELMSEYEIDAVFKCDTPPSLDRDHASSLFRCTREILVNVVKHAEASTVELEVEHNGSSLCITIRDNGRGLNIDSLRNRKAARGYGLLSCENTLESLGGRLEIRAPIEGGTEVTMNTPLHNEAVE
tara:strand:+ start:723 stop:2360 length:1638 start_codon:yes stop_codon:yes gene_type:complete